MYNEKYHTFYVFINLDKERGNKTQILFIGISSMILDIAHSQIFLSVLSWIYVSSNKHTKVRNCLQTFYFWLILRLQTAVTADTNSSITVSMKARVVTWNL